MTAIEKKKLLFDRPRHSLGCDPNMAHALRLLLPVAWVMNVGLFLWSNCEPASVKVIVDLKFTPMGMDGNATQTTEPIIPPVFLFSLINTTRDMWHAEVYLLAILVFFMSGVWPYIKLFMMIVAFYAVPDKHMSIATRYSTLPSHHFIPSPFDER
jgi:hypothetical protein